jgi:hypothetical protein
MTDPDRSLWPYRPRTTLVWTGIILVSLLVFAAISRLRVGWPTDERVVLIGIGLLSLLPILLAIVDTVIKRGGTFEFRGVKLDFAKTSVTEIPGMAIAANFGLPAQPVTDSSTTAILDTLRQATRCEAVIIDLGDGEAWWETRLLVLLAGAVRLGKPEKIVFLGTDGQAPRRFHGWAHSRDLLPPLLNSHPEYQLSYHAAMAAGRQWSMVEPVGRNLTPPIPPWMNGAVALKHPWMAFDGASGLPNKLYPEQILSSELGERVERQEQSRRITLVRMEELFRPMLYHDNLDETWSQEQQLKSFFDGAASYLAVTHGGEFVKLVSRVTILNSMVERLVIPKEAARK